MSEIILKTDHLTTGYASPRRPAVVVSTNVQLDLYKGELVCLIGPNGAGKSTLMQTLAGMLKPIHGGVLLRGQDVHHMRPLELAKSLSIVLTERPNVGTMTGEALVALGRHPYTDWSGQLSPHDRAMVEWAINAVGAEAFAARPAAELSDGQRQKIMIARALAQEPEVMILDEPTAFLDLPRRVEMMRLLKTLARETHRAILLSTHDLDLALHTADRLWLLPANAPIQVGAPEDLILNGGFEQVFDSEGVEFNVNTGTFKVVAQNRGAVAVRGEGLGLIWTRRALQREGFTISSDKSDFCIEVMSEGWRLSQNGEISDHATIYDLMQKLNRQN